MTDTRVVDNPDRSQFELLADGEVAGYVRYLERDGSIVLVHTEVDAAYAGRGYGSRLARGTLDLIRDSGRPMVNECPFLLRWVERNPEYADVGGAATP
jgi:predicted GNAT family acetyltransferase